MLRCEGRMHENNKISVESIVFEISNLFLDNPMTFKPEFSQTDYD